MTKSAMLFVVLVLMAEIVRAEIPAVGADFEPVFQRGVCLVHNHGKDVGYGSEASRRALREIRDLGANFVSIHPLGYAWNPSSPDIVAYRGEDPTMTPDAIRQVIRDAHSLGLAVMLVPHIRVGVHWSEDQWRGSIRMESSEAWNVWFKSYREFIVFFALLAAEEGVELFCIGSELEGTTGDEHDAEWKQVIEAVRSVYPGPLTYGANWSGEFQRIGFWSLVEYIGISAYFPLGRPYSREVPESVVRVRKELAALAEQTGKPIIFTEVGFQSRAGAGAAPYDWQRDNPRTDNDEQRLLYETWLSVMYGEPWVSGIYWWLWWTDGSFADKDVDGYSFRSKPAEAVVRRYFEGFGR